MYKLYNRYLRHIVLPNFGINSQDILFKSKILCIGAGGLGSPAITYLAMLGIGAIDIIEFDTIEKSNLNRQFIFKERDIGKNKILITKKYIKNINKNIKVNIFNKKLTPHNCFNMLKKYDVILDCTDNIESKILISDNGIKLNTPVVHGAIFGFEGYITIFDKNSICHRCLYKQINISTCVEYGVFGPTAGIIGILQASETIKILLRKYTKLQSELLIIDLSTLKIKILKITKNKFCTIC